MTPGECFPQGPPPEGVCPEPPDAPPAGRAPEPPTSTPTDGQVARNHLEQLRAEVRRMPGLKGTDLKPCAICGRGVMHARDLTFFHVTIERYMLDLGAVQRAHGLELVIGNPVIANVIGPDEDLAKRIHLQDRVVVCDHCAIHGGPLAALSEAIEPTPSGDAA